MKPRFRNRPELQRSRFGTVLIALLDAKGWTLAGFAERLGRSRSSLFKVVQGKLKPPLAELDGWIAKLDLDRDGAVALIVAAVEEHGCSSLRREIERS